MAAGFDEEEEDVDSGTSISHIQLCWQAAERAHATIFAAFVRLVRFCLACILHRPLRDLDLIGDTIATLTEDDTRRCAKGVSGIGYKQSVKNRRRRGDCQAFESCERCPRTTPRHSLHHLLQRLTHLSSTPNSLAPTVASSFRRSRATLVAGRVVIAPLRFRRSQGTRAGCLLARLTEQTERR